MFESNWSRFDIVISYAESLMSTWRFYWKETIEALLMSQLDVQKKFATYQCQIFSSNPSWVMKSNGDQIFLMLRFTTVFLCGLNFFLIEFEINKLKKSYSQCLYRIWLSIVKSKNVVRNNTIWISCSWRKYYRLGIPRHFEN